MKTFSLKFFVFLFISWIFTSTIFAGETTGTVTTGVTTGVSGTVIAPVSSSGGGGGGGGGTYIPPTPTPEISPEIISETSIVNIETCNDYFPDTQNHWAKKYICFLKFRGIVSGKNSEVKKDEDRNSENEDVKFFPEDSITRAEVVKIAVLGFNIPELENLEENNDDEKLEIFPDISATDWYFDFVLRAKNLEIINGRKNGNFDPNSPITRAEAVKILLLSAKIEISSDKNEENFSDVPQYSWYYNLVSTAQKLEIISGKSDGKFHPEENITRAEFSKITALLLK